MLKNLSESNRKVDKSPEALRRRFYMMGQLFLAGRYFIKRLKKVPAVPNTDEPNSAAQLRTDNKT